MKFHGLTHNLRKLVTNKYFGAQKLSSKEKLHVNFSQKEVFLTQNLSKK